MPMSNADVVSAGAALHKALSGGNASTCVEILERLRDELVATDAVLKETKIGLHVGKLRKAPNASVAALANEVVKKWKSDLAGGGTTATPAETTLLKKKLAADAKPTQPTQATAAQAQQPQATAPRTVDTDAVKINQTTEPVRNNCIKLTYNALACDAPTSVDAETLLGCAVRIEKACYVSVGGGSANSAYKQKMRSLYLNLKGTNRSLREGVRDGVLEADRLVGMSAEEMASSEKRAKDEQLQQMNIFNSLAATAATASTDMFQCGKCKKRKCTYYQMQTRSADEPMTTFVTCVECGNKWKF
ncbi:transcription elongation factor TFIIS [Savitreella phatthalungensis]